MSYDIYLRDPVTGETAEVPGHMMVGGTFRADYHPETEDEKGNVVRDPLDVIMKKLPVEKKKITEERYEGPNRDYWEPTAANAIKPLYQLIALAKMRPDCIWDGD